MRIFGACYRITVGIVMRTDNDKGTRLGTKARNDVLVTRFLDLDFLNCNLGPDSFQLPADVFCCQAQFLVLIETARECVYRQKLDMRSKTIGIDLGRARSHRDDKRLRRCSNEQQQNADKYKDGNEQGACDRNWKPLR